MKPSQPIYIFIMLVTLVLMFLLTAFLIMLTYNNSIPQMNPNWNKIDYRRALIFTLFLSLIFSGCGNIQYKS